MLLTGAQGLLGRSVAWHWLGSSREAEIVGLGRSPRLPDRYTHQLRLGAEQVPARLPAALVGIESHPRYHYVRADVNDVAALDRVLAEERPDVVVHSAAALRDDSVSSLVRTNVEATATLIERCCASSDVSRAVLVSSGSVYGRVPLDEQEARLIDGPPEPYALTKRAGEQLAAALALRGGLALDVARVFNLIGPGLQTRHLPALVCARLEAIRRGDEPPLLQLGDLSPRRDLVAIDDAARAVVALAAAPHVPDRTGGRVFDVGTGEATLMRDLVAMLVEEAGLTEEVTVRETGRRVFDVAEIVADTTSLRAVGVLPATTLRDSCAGLLAYVRDHWAATG